MLKQLLTIVTLIFIGGGGAMAKDYTVCSPNGKNEVTVGNGITISVCHDGKPVVKVKAGLSVQSNLQPGSGKVTSATETIPAPFYRQKSFTAAYRQLDMKLSGGFGLQVRVYDEGVGYRFYTTRQTETIIVDEMADFCFPDNGKCWLAYSTNEEKPFAMAFQNFYDETKLSEARNQFAFLPATIQSGEVKVTILESDLRNYPGMFLKKGDGNTLVWLIQRIILQSHLARGHTLGG